MKTLKEFLGEGKHQPKIGFPKSDDHTKWNDSGHKEFTKDIESSGHSVEVHHLDKPMEVYGHAHHHSFGDGVPVSKYFHRHDTGYKGSHSIETKLPKGSKVLHRRDENGDPVCSYGHHPKHGFIKFDD